MPNPLSVAATPECKPQDSILPYCHLERAGYKRRLRDLEFPEAREKISEETLLLHGLLRNDRFGGQD